MPKSSIQAAKNEIGEMARALEVFKANGKAAIEAAEREKTATIEREQAEDRKEREQKAQDEAMREQAKARRQAMIEELSTSIGAVVDAGSKGDFSKRVEAQFDDPQLAALSGSVNELVENVESGLTEAARSVGAPYQAVI